MHRAIAIPVIALAACAPTTRPPAVPDDLPPVAVDVRVTTTDDKPAVLLAGRMDVAPRRIASLEHHGARSSEVERLRLNAAPREDGLYRVELDWSETSAEGRRVMWTASLVVKRGASATQRMDWPGGGRQLDLTLR